MQSSLQLSVVYLHDGCTGVYVIPLLPPMSRNSGLRELQLIIWDLYQPRRRTIESLKENVETYMPFIYCLFNTCIALPTQKFSTRFDNNIVQLGGCHSQRLSALLFRTSSIYK